MSSLKTAWRLMLPYFKSEEKWGAFTLVLLILGLNVLWVYILVLMNEWSKLFYNALQEFNQEAFFAQIIQFFYLVFYVLATFLTKFFCVQYLSIKWRAWLVAAYLKDWLKDQAYYKMKLLKDPTDNPDQRISDDIGSFTASTLHLIEIFFNETLTLISFSVILWNLSGPLTIFGDLVVPGYLFWAALIYAGGGTYIALKIGHPLVKLDFEGERLNADFRYSLIRLRENTESIAFYKGEAQEDQEFSRRFSKIIQNIYSVIRRSIYLSTWNNLYNNMDKIFPVLMVAPRFFKKELDLGGVMQISGAFSTVRGSLSVIIDNYFSIANWQAVVMRLDSFQNSLESMRDLSSLPHSHIKRIPNPKPNHLSINLETLSLPDGMPLLKNIELDLKRGDRVLISGASGVGKSTLLRAIAGMWPFGTGEIHIPPDTRMLFIPQRPYMPLGSLKTALAYPLPAQTVSQDIGVEAIMDLCGLSALKNRLEDVDDWSRILSLGEQQRISFARALIQKPDWLFLDEVTSALDEVSEAKLYQLLIDYLPNTAIISVGHRSTIRPFHTNILEFKAPELIQKRT